MRITVALLGVLGEDLGFVPEDQWVLPWGERQQIELEVEDSESLRAVKNRALAEFGLPVPDWAADLSGAYPFVSFDGDAHEDGRPWLHTTLALVDDQGRAVWGVHDFGLVPYAQLVASAHAGVVRGDPTRLLVATLHPQGNGLYVDWDSLMYAWETAFTVLEHVAAIAGAAEGVRRLRGTLKDRLQRGRGALERNKPRWGQRGADPLDLVYLLRSRDWATADLARVLDCSQDDVEALLVSFGWLDEDGDERWEPADEDAARLLRKIIDEAEYANEARHGQRAGERFRERVTHVIETGDALPHEILDAYPAEQAAVPEVVSVVLTSTTVSGYIKIGEREVQIQAPLWTADDDHTELFDRASRAL